MHGTAKDYTSRALVSFVRGYTAFLWAVAALSLLILIASINRGFSGLDESYYLSLIIDPARFKANLHAFGFPFHLLFVALGKSIIAFRIAGLVLLATSGALLGHTLKRYCRPFLVEGANPPLIILGGLFSLTEHVMWIPTPAYNALLSISSCVLLAGALSWLSNDRDGDHRLDWLASVAVGLGGCFAFFAKAPSAMLGAIGIGVLLLASCRNLGFRAILRRAAIVAIACLVPLAVILHVVVGIWRYFEMVRTALAVLHFNNGLLELPGRTLRELAAGPTVFLISLGVFVGILIWTRVRSERIVPRARVSWLTALWLGVTVAFMAARIAYRAANHAAPFLYVGMPMLAMTLAALAFAFAQYVKRPAPAFLGLLGLLVAIPFLSAYGSANPIFVQISMWLYGPLFALVLAGRVFFSSNVARFVEMACAAFVLFVLVLSAQLPWGLSQPVYRQTEPLAFPFSSDTILVDPQTAQYAADLRRFAKSGKLGVNTPVFDLTGSSAGTALLLNNRAPFLPWVFPMFENSAEIADGMWDSLTSTEKRGAWIIAPIDPRFRKTRVAEYLIQHRNAYKLVGRTSLNFGYITPYTQSIDVWQPVERTTDR